MKTLVQYLKELGAAQATKVMGPNGAFISYTKVDGSKGNVPVGGKSQNGALSAYKMFVTPDGTHIATVNEYRTVETWNANDVPVFEADAKETSV